MRRFPRCILVVFAAGVLLALPYACFPQNPADPAVTLKRLSPPVYPVIALTARVQGDVELLLQVRLDGSVESATVVSGPPLLLRASLSSAQQSQFNCLHCLEQATPYHLTYTFQIENPPDPCKEGDVPGKPTSIELVPEVALSKGHVTLTGHPSSSCGIVYAKKVRSWRCLYLWKCGLSF
jgi:Gram-negative bacterial TonB protein C-terminal